MVQMYKYEARYTRRVDDNNNINARPRCDTAIDKYDSPVVCPVNAIANCIHNRRSSYTHFEKANTGYTDDKVLYLFEQ